MRSRLRAAFVHGIFLPAMLLAFLHGTAGLAAAQTNINIQGDGRSREPVRDTLLIRDTVVQDGPMAVLPDAGEQDPAVDTVGDIEPSDTRRLQRRKEAKRFTMAGFGPAGFGNELMDDNDDRMVYDVYVGRAWEVSPRAAIKSLAEVATDFDDNHVADVSLGANFYAMPTDFSPYVGGDLGLGLGRGDDENAFGFTASGTVGALLFRTANAQLNLEGGAEVMLSELQDEFPTVYSATVGVLF